MTTTKATRVTTITTMTTMVVAVAVAVETTMANHLVIQCKYEQVNEAK